MKSQPGLQTIAINIFPNVSQSKGNQAMQFGQFFFTHSTNSQLHSTKPELRFCAGSNPARAVSEIHDGEDL